MAEEEGTNTVELLVRRLREGSDSPSVIRSADRVFRKALPVATVACRVEMRGAPQAEVEEIVQQTLETVWRRIEDFEPNGPPFEAWVRGIAKRVCANERRRKRDLLSEDGIFEAQDPAQDILRRLQREERARIVSESIDAVLTPEDQDVFNHRYLHGLERAQIAELVGLADAEAVRVILQRSTRRLRAEILRRLSLLGHSQSLLRSEGG